MKIQLATCIHTWNFDLSSFVKQDVDWLEGWSHHWCLTTCCLVIIAMSQAQRRNCHCEGGHGGVDGGWWWPCTGRGAIYASMCVCVRVWWRGGWVQWGQERLRCRCEPLIIEWHVSCHSFIVTGHVHIWALSHYSSSICPTWPLSDARTHTHTQAHKHTHTHSIQLSIQADKSSVHYNIYTSQLFLCAQLRLGEIVLQNTAYTLFTLHSLCLFCSPFLCNTTLWTCAGRNPLYTPASLSMCNLKGSLRYLKDSSPSLNRESPLNYCTN